jgi:HEAT repeat protein
VHAMSLVPVANRFLRSRLWWRRALALRALGLLQIKTHTAAIVDALDDPSADVRAAALDAIADLRDMAALPALVVRLHDESLHRGRRVVALSAFGCDCEPLLLEMAEVDRANRLNYAEALAVCGTPRSRPLLCRWTQDAHVEVRAAAFEALGHIGLDEDVAPLVIDALESDAVLVRAKAARALRGWVGPAAAAPHLARHLDDAWPVAVQAARSLRTMGDVGISALQASASRPGLPGLLARQTLWEVGAPC